MHAANMKTIHSYMESMQYNTLCELPSLSLTHIAVAILLLLKLQQLLNSETEVNHLKSKMYTNV